MNGNVTQFGYVGIDTTDVAGWAKLADAVGFETATTDEGGLELRMDADRGCRIRIHPATEDRIAYAGWEVADADALQTLRERLEKHGIQYEHATEAADGRGVQDLLTFVDHDGLQHEAYWGMRSLQRTQFRSPHQVKFLAGDLGLGHLTLGVKDLPRSRDFYLQVLGMNLSEVADVRGKDVLFLNCNPRHHSMALAQIPADQMRVLHLMVEVVEMDDLGSIRDRLIRAGLSIGADLGRHPTDNVISLYANTPAPFELEIGCGSILVHQDTWATDRYQRDGWSWGHQRVAVDYSDQVLSADPAPAAVPPSN